MEKVIRFLTLFLVAIATLVFIYYGFVKFDKCEKELYTEISNKFAQEAIHWRDSIIEAKNLTSWGNYNSQGYKDKKETKIITRYDTIIISTQYYHPEEYDEYKNRNLETSLIMSGRYDICITDSLFENLLKTKDIIAESSTELHVKELSEMFPTPEVMKKDVQVANILSNKKIDGFITEPVGVGICDHALLYGYINIPATEVLKKIEWVDVTTISIVLFVFLVLFLRYICIRYLSLLISYKKDTKILGNTCIDLNKNVVYLYNGECKQVIGNKIMLLQMLIDSAPTYKLLKEDVCRKIWNRDSKDGQALYNVAMSELRNLFINADPSLELKSIPREGMQLLVNTSLVKKMIRWHFIGIFIKVALSKTKRNIEMD